MPDSYQIWRVQFNLKQSTDRRPGIIVTVNADDFCEVMLLSSAMDLYDPKRDFLISSNNADFGATGLSKTSYVYGLRSFDIESQRLEKQYGQLQGRLLADFKIWLG